MTRVLASPCATIVRARKTSAIPPVPIFRMSWYLPNCSIGPVDESTGSSRSLQRRDDEVVEPGIGLPVVEREVLVAAAFERVRIVVDEERCGHVVDPPGQRLAAPLDLPVIVLTGDDLGIDARDDVFAVLVEPRDDRLRVVPTAEDHLVANCGVGTTVGIERVSIAEHLDLDVAARLVRPAVEFDPDVVRELAA